MKNSGTYISLILFILFKNLEGFAQEKPSKNYFQSPLDIPMKLAGNFGEIRPNHFHAGLDIKTDGVEGQKIYAAAEGYVYRINVSPYGYGTSIYINHPNGYTTVYAHLKKFSDKIEAYVKKAQYAKESFEVELFPAKDILAVNKGDIIAYSGNTGGSSGPHLHFEIRDAITEYPVNPLLFGFEITDSRKPVPKTVKIYAIGNTGLVDDSEKPKTFHITGDDGSYRMNTKKPVEVYGNIGFGIEAVDYLDGSHNTCGVYSIELLVDNQRTYYHEMERFGFHENRYINSHVDYKDFKTTRSHIQKCFIAPNNRLGIYKQTLNRGLINFSDDTLHNILYIIKDAYGNTSKLNFNVKSTIPSPADLRKMETVSEEPDWFGKGGSPTDVPTLAVENTDYDLAIDDLLKDKTTGNITKFFKYQYENSLRTKDFYIELPAGSLYEDMLFEFSVSDTFKGAISPTYKIHNEFVPVHTNFNISIKAENIDSLLRKKALIAEVKNNGAKNYAGGKWQGEFITSKVRYLGNYAVFVDTTPPVITPVNIYNDKSMIGRWSITIKAYDILSGIASYRGEVDGKWVLMEYDAKNSRFMYFFDENIAKGEHEFKMSVSDNRGNVAEYKAKFTR